MSDGKYAGIPREKEYELIRRGKGGDKLAMRELIDAHTPFIAQIIKEFTLPPWVPMEDVLQEGRIGMIDAVHRFDLESGYGLCTYAAWRIRKAVSGYLSEMGYSTKIPHTDVVKLKKVNNRLEMGLSPTPDEDLKLVNAPKSLNILNLLTGCMPIHPTVHGTSFADNEHGVSESGWAGHDPSLLSKESTDHVIGRILMEEVVHKMGELTVIEGVMLGLSLGFYVADNPVPLKYIAGERSRHVKKSDDEVDVVGGIPGFGLECGETYNNCSRLIKQGEAKLRNILAEFLEDSPFDDYLEG